MNWNQNLLYPAGVDAHQIQVEPKMVVPPDWQFGTALPVASASGNDITFKPASLRLLIDSPVLAGQYMRKISRPGRTWKPLLDTAVSIPGMFG